MKNWVITILAVLVGAAGYATWDRVGPTLRAESAYEVAVKENLKDPASAIFRNVRKVTFGYCGEVNAKISYGAYVGFQEFHASEKPDGSGWSAIMEPELIRIFCK